MHGLPYAHIILLLLLTKIFISSFLSILLVKSFSMYNNIDTVSQVFIFLRAANCHLHEAELIESVKALINLKRSNFSHNHNI